MYIISGGFTMVVQALIAGAAFRTIHLSNV